MSRRVPLRGSDNNGPKQRHISTDESLSMSDSDSDLSIEDPDTVISPRPTQNTSASATSRSSTATSKTQMVARFTTSDSSTPATRSTANASSKKLDSLFDDEDESLESLVNRIPRRFLMPTGFNPFEFYDNEGDLMHQKQRVDRAVDGIVAHSYKGFQQATASFRAVLQTFTSSQQSVRQLKADILEARRILTTRNSHIRALHQEHRALTHAVAVLAQVESVRAAPGLIARAMARHQYLRAALLLMHALSLLVTPTLRDLAALLPVREGLLSLRLDLERQLTDRLQAIIFLKDPRLRLSATHHHATQRPPPVFAGSAAGTPHPFGAGCGHRESPAPGDLVPVAATPGAGDKAVAASPAAGAASAGPSSPTPGSTPAGSGAVDHEVAARASIGNCYARAWLALEDCRGGLAPPSQVLVPPSAAAVSSALPHVREAPLVEEVDDLSGSDSPLFPVWRGAQLAWQLLRSAQGKGKALSALSALVDASQSGGSTGAALLRRARSLAQSTPRGSLALPAGGVLSPLGEGRGMRPSISLVAGSQGPRSSFSGGRAGVGALSGGSGALGRPPSRADNVVGDGAGDVPHKYQKLYHYRLLAIENLPSYVADPCAHPVEHTALVVEALHAMQRLPAAQTRLARGAEKALAELTEREVKAAVAARQRAQKTQRDRPFTYAGEDEGGDDALSVATRKDGALVAVIPWRPGDGEAGGDADDVRLACDLVAVVSALHAKAIEMAKFACAHSTWLMCGGGVGSDPANPQTLSANVAQRWWTRDNTLETHRLVRSICGFAQVQMQQLLWALLGRPRAPLIMPLPPADPSAPPVPARGKYKPGKAVREVARVRGATAQGAPQLTFSLAHSALHSLAWEQEVVASAPEFRSPKQPDAPLPPRPTATSPAVALAVHPAHAPWLLLALARPLALHVAVLALITDGHPVAAYLPPPPALSLFEPPGPYSPPTLTLTLALTNGPVPAAPAPPSVPPRSARAPLSRAPALPSLQEDARAPASGLSLSLLTQHGHSAGALSAPSPTPIAAASMGVGSLLASYSSSVQPRHPSLDLSPHSSLWPLARALSVAMEALLQPRMAAELAQLSQAAMADPLLFAPTEVATSTVSRSTYALLGHVAPIRSSRQLEVSARPHVISPFLFTFYSATLQKNVLPLAALPLPPPPPPLPAPLLLCRIAALAAPHLHAIASDARLAPTASPHFVDALTRLVTWLLTQARAHYMTLTESSGVPVLAADMLDSKPEVALALAQDPWFVDLRQPTLAPTPTSAESTAFAQARTLTSSTSPCTQRLFQGVPTARTLGLAAGTGASALSALASLALLATTLDWVANALYHLPLPLPFSLEGAHVPRHALALRTGTARDESTVVSCMGGFSQSGIYIPDLAATVPAPRHPNRHHGLAPTSSPASSPTNAGAAYAPAVGKVVVATGGAEAAAFPGSGAIESRTTALTTALAASGIRHGDVTPAVALAATQRDLAACVALARSCPSFASSRSYVCEETVARQALALDSSPVAEQLRARVAHATAGTGVGGDSGVCGWASETDSAAAALADTRWLLAREASELADKCYKTVKLELWVRVARALGELSNCCNSTSAAPTGITANIAANGNATGLGIAAPTRHIDRSARGSISRLVSSVTNVGNREASSALAALSASASAAAAAPAALLLPSTSSSDDTIVWAASAARQMTSVVDAVRSVWDTARIQYLLGGLPALLSALSIRFAARASSTANRSLPRSLQRGASTLQQTYMALRPLCEHLSVLGTHPVYAHQSDAHAEMPFDALQTYAELLTLKGGDVEAFWSKNEGLFAREDYAAALAYAKRG